MKINFSITLFIIGFFLLGFSIANILNNNSNKVLNTQGEIVNLPSQCYTDLQSQNYFNSTGVKYFINNHSTLTISIPNSRTIDFTVVKNTGSMRPSIPDNSKVLLIKPKDENDIKIGDIININVLDKDSNILHRVINIYSNGTDTIYLTKGDNNEEDDLKAFNLTVSFKMIEGRAVGVLY